jgi:hypothetical protein
MSSAAKARLSAAAGPALMLPCAARAHSRGNCGCTFSSVVYTRRAHSATMSCCTDRPCTARSSSCSRSSGYLQGSAAVSCSRRRRVRPGLQHCQAAQRAAGPAARQAAGRAPSRLRTLPCRARSSHSPSWPRSHATAPCCPPRPHRLQLGAQQGVSAPRGGRRPTNSRCGRAGAGRPGSSSGQRAAARRRAGSGARGAHPPPSA